MEGQNTEKSITQENALEKQKRLMKGRLGFFKAAGILGAGLLLPACNPEKVETPIPQYIPSTEPPVKPNNNESKEIKKESIFLSNPRKYSKDEITVKTDPSYSNYVTSLDGKQITYSEKIHSQITYLFFTNPMENNTKPVVGEVIPLEYQLPVGSIDRMLVGQFAWSGQNRTKEIDVSQLKNPSVMPIVTSGANTQGILPIRTADGQMVSGGTYEPFSVIEGPGGQDEGYLSLALFEEGEDSSEKIFLGIVSVSNPPIYIDETQGVPEEIDWVMNQ